MLEQCTRAVAVNDKVYRMVEYKGSYFALLMSSVEEQKMRTQHSVDRGER